MTDEEYDLEHEMSLHELNMEKLREIAQNNGLNTFGTKEDLIAKIVAEDIVADIRQCARCGGTHLKLLFSQLTRPIEETSFTHWAMCPMFFEPILLSKA